MCVFVVCLFARWVTRLVVARLMYFLDRRQIYNVSYSEDERNGKSLENNEGVLTFLSHLVLFVCVEKGIQTMSLGCKNDEWWKLEVACSLVKRRRKCIVDGSVDYHQMRNSLKLFVCGANSFGRRSSFSSPLIQFHSNQITVAVFTRIDQVPLALWHFEQFQCYN